MALNAATLERPAGRGRQAAEVEELRDLREELTADRLEGAHFAARVAYIGTQIRGRAVAAGELAIADFGSELQALAVRHLRQRSSGVL